jgi:hypothetical protein
MVGDRYGLPKTEHLLLWLRIETRRACALRCVMPYQRNIAAILRGKGANSTHLRAGIVPRCVCAASAARRIKKF